LFDIVSQNEQGCGRQKQNREDRQQPFLPAHGPHTPDIRLVFMTP
jgi:hypothetical protein